MRNAFQICERLSQICVVRSALQTSGRLSQTLVRLAFSFAFISAGMSRVAEKPPPESSSVSSPPLIGRRLFAHLVRLAFSLAFINATGTAGGNPGGPCKTNSGFATASAQMILNDDTA